MKKSKAYEESYEIDKNVKHPWNFAVRSDIIFLTCTVFVKGREKFFEANLFC